MALQKTFTLANGMSGNYVKLGVHHWDGVRKIAEADLVLFKDASFAAAGLPIGILGRLNLEGAKFDEYLGNDALDTIAEAEAAGLLPEELVPVRSRERFALYSAAKAERLRPGLALTTAAIDLSAAEDV